MCFAIIILLLTAMSITAYAISYTCQLFSGHTYAETTHMASKIAHSSGYNQSYSNGKMGVVMQQLMDDGHYGNIEPAKNANPGETVKCSTWMFNDIRKFRTKIYPVSGSSVEGVGSINDN